MSFDYCSYFLTLGYKKWNCFKHINRYVAVFLLEDCKIRTVAVIIYLLISDLIIFKELNNVTVNRIIWVKRIYPIDFNVFIILRSCWWLRFFWNARCVNIQYIRPLRPTVNVMSPESHLILLSWNNTLSYLCRNLNRIWENYSITD